MQTLDGRHSDSCRRNYLVKSHCRTDNSSNSVYLDPVILKGRTNSVIVDVKFLLAHLVLSVSIVLEEIKRRELEALKLFTVVNSRKVFSNLVGKVASHYDFHT